MCCYVVVVVFCTTHRQSQLICPQCNKYEDRLNRFPFEVRLIYACIELTHTHTRTHSAGNSLRFLHCSSSSSTSMIFFCSIFHSAILVMWCSFDFQFSIRFLLPIGMNVVCCCCCLL